eukprot:7379703-Pyramimonas_sp.AAC.1
MRPLHWGLRWSSLWGHKLCEGCATMGRCRHANFGTGAFGGGPCGATEPVRGAPKWAVPPCEFCHWGPRWSSL